MGEGDFMRIGDWEGIKKDLGRFREDWENFLRENWEI